MGHPKDSPRMGKSIYFSFYLVRTGKYKRPRRFPMATEIQIIEPAAQTTKTIPVDVKIFPIPTKGETSPPAANPNAPRMAEAVPALSRCLCMANVVVEVKVIPTEKSNNNNKAS